MCGSETLTTVVSNTSMKVLDITATATSQGLISRGGEGVEAIAIDDSRNATRKLRDNLPLMLTNPGLLH